MTENAKPKDAKAEIAELRDRVQQLSDPVEPVVANAAETAKTYAADAAEGARQYAQQAQAAVSDQAESFAATIRHSPIKAVLAACVAGYVVGRIVR